MSRTDLRLLSRPGYDADTGLFFEPTGETFRIPEQPTQDDVARAVGMLLDVVCDFPFARPAHKSAWLAYVLTPLAREAIDGPAPLFLHDATVQGSGKGLLADVGSLIATGHECARTSNCDNAEWRKRITSLALAGDRIVMIDNVVGELGCASLDAALTATTWQDRIVATSQIPSLPLSMTWAASGNNVVLAADTPRRTCHIRLRSPLENPEVREGFKYPNLLRYVRENRSELTSAALTILHGYFVAGCPKAKLKPWGSYEAWSDIIRQAIIWCGLPDPGDTREQLAATADRQAVALRQLIAAWEEVGGDQGITASAALESAKGCRLLWEAIVEICGSKEGELPNPKSLGMVLRNLRGRTVGGKAIDDVGEARNGAAIWSVVSVDQQMTVDPGSAGSAGSDMEGPAGGSD